MIVTIAFLKMILTKELRIIHRQWKFTYRSRIDCLVQDETQLNKSCNRERYHKLPIKKNRENSPRICIAKPEAQ